MDTIRIADKQQTLVIAHRGMSALETENTLPAFVAAGNRTHIGIESDVHKTADGEFVIIHDDNTGRVCEIDLCVEDSALAQLRALELKDRAGLTGRIDLHIPTLEEYIGVCKAYDKVSVLEFKNRFEKEDIAEVIRRIDALGWLDHVIFISFWYENLLDLRELLPDQPAQFLTGNRDDFDWLIGELASHRFGLDVQFGAVTKELVDACHAAGVPVNCWTVDHPDDAARLIACGVDYITTNVLE